MSCQTRVRRRALPPANKLSDFKPTMLEEATLGCGVTDPAFARVSRFFKKNLKKKKSLENVTTPLMPRAPGGVSPP